MPEAERVGANDVDNLEGQALADAFAVEVMGWTLHRGAPDPDPPEDYWSSGVPVGAFRPDEEWHWFGVAFDRVTKPEPEGLGLRTGMHTGGRPGSWVYLRRPTNVDFALANDDSEDFKAAFLRVAIKAVRAIKEGREGVAHT